MSLNFGNYFDKLVKLSKHLFIRQKKILQYCFHLPWQRKQTNIRQEGCYCFFPVYVLWKHVWVIRMLPLQWWKINISESKTLFTMLFFAATLVGTAKWLYDWCRVVSDVCTWDWTLVIGSHDILIKPLLSWSIVKYLQIHQVINIE